MNGGSFIDLMKAADYHPMEEETDEAPVTTSVQLPPDLHEHLLFIAKLWNALDVAREKPRRTKWKPASVIRRLLTVGRDAIGLQLGGIPVGEEAQAAFIASTAAKLAAEVAKSKSKK